MASQRYQNTANKLSLAKECYSMKLDLLTNATVVDDAIRFVSQISKSKEDLNQEQSETHHAQPRYLTWKRDAVSYNENQEILDLC